MGRRATTGKVRWDWINVANLTNLIKGKEADSETPGPIGT